MFFLVGIGIEQQNRLLLLDTAPLMPPPVLRSMALCLKLRAVVRALGRRQGRPAARTYARPRSVSQIVRMAWYLLCDGPKLAADLSAAKLDGMPSRLGW